MKPEESYRQVFIIDDDIAVCRALSVLLLTYGFTVDTFTSTEEFISAVPKSAPGCMVLDIHMQGFDGWETLLNFMISGSHRPVIMISADKNERFNEAALKSGAVGFLQKPIDGQELVDLLNIALEMKSSRGGIS